MPTPLDRALHQRVSSPNSPSRIEEKDVSSNAETKKAPLFAFGAIVTGIAAWTIWGSDIFPSTDPSGGTFSFYFFLVQNTARFVCLCVFFLSSGVFAGT
jgi:hypothetical protein